MPDPNSDDEELRAAMDMKMEVLEFHYREREAQSNGTANGNGLINQNNSSSSNIPQQLRLEKTQGNSTNSTKKNNSNSKDREKQNSTTNSRRKEPVAISASQLPVYSVKSATAKHPNNSEAESSAQPANKRKKKISDKAVEDEFEFPLAKRKPVKREPAVENEEVWFFYVSKVLIPFFSPRTCLELRMKTSLIVMNLMKIIKTHLLQTLFLMVWQMISRGVPSETSLLKSRF